MGLLSEANESMGAGVDAEAKGCGWFFKPSSLPEPPTTPKGARKAPIGGGDTVALIPVSPTAFSGAGKASKPPLKSPSPSKSKPSCPINGFGDVEADDGGGGIALTLDPSKSGELGHNMPPRAAAWLTRLCVR